MRIIICDDQAIVRDGLKLLLELEEDIEVVALAQNGSEAIDLVIQHNPDLVLMDLKMPIMNGIEATRQITQHRSQIKVLALTTYDADEWIFDAIRAGASGYLLKDTPHKALIEAVRGTVAGKNYIDPTVTGKLMMTVTSTLPSPQLETIASKLSERELDVLRLIAKGMTNYEIAESLCLSEGTIRNYVSAILTKLDVGDRTQAAVIALRNGLG